MFSRDAIRALEEGCLSDLELSSDDEGPVGPASERELRCVRVGADLISRNQREVFPPASEDDDDEDAGPSWVMNDNLLPEVPSASEDMRLENITPKHSIRWRHKEIVNTISPARFPPIAIDPRVESPVDYYNKYVPKQLFQVMAEMTNLYATHSNKLRFKPTCAKEIEILFGLHLATGIFGYPCLKMYWETNISISLFNENMARDRFFELRNNLHLVDSTAIPSNSNDTFIKVRPIFDAVRERCLELPLEENLCVDEQIVPFTGKHVAKQYIKGKPCPWGLKIFFLCGKHGQAYDFIINQSSSPEIDKNLTKKIGFGAAVVLQLTKRIRESKGHQLYFDNYFSSYHLLQILKQRGIMAAGTIRINRFAKPSLLSDKEMNKKPRGFAQEMTSYDEDVTVVKWLDNKITHLASNFVGIGEKDLVKRWCKKDKHFIEVERPEIVRKYNHAMGGVDLLDQLMSYYRTFIKSKKWTLRMIFHASDLAVVQAYREYQVDNEVLGIPKDKQLTLLHFRRQLAESMVLQNKITMSKRGRPSRSSPILQIVPRRPGETRPKAEIAQDGVGHFPAHDEGLGTRCKLVGCNGRTRIKCIKCKIHLCLTKDKNCFLAFHT